MANHRPKSLSELNNVYDKAIKAQRAIREGSDMLTDNEIPQEESIFRQMEAKAAQAEKNQVYDPEIANIANDFIKRYTKPEPKAKAPVEVKRPAPSIKSFHKPVKQDVSLDMGSDETEGLVSSVPVHRPVSAESLVEKAAPPAPVEKKEPRAVVPAAAAVAQAPEEKTEPEKAPEKAPLQQTPQTPPAAAVKAPIRARISSSERNELMEEYLRVMSDEDDEPSFRKPKFNLFKKKKKSQEPEEPQDIYSNYDTTQEDSSQDIPVVAFDSSDVKYTDEYSDLPQQESQEDIPEEKHMGFYDYVAEDFGDEAQYEEDEALDMSDTLFTSDNSYDHNEDIVSTTEYTPSQDDIPFEIPFEAEAPQEEPVVQEAAEEEITVIEPAEETAEAQEEAPEAEEAAVGETAEETEAAEITEAEEASEETTEAIEITEAEETAEAIEVTEAEETAEAEEIAEVFEEAEDNNQLSPPADMVFDDIFSVSDADKRSYTGGNWSEILQEVAPSQQEDEDYYDYGENDALYDNDSPHNYPAKKKGTGFAKFLCGLVMVISLLAATFTAVVPGFVKINTTETFYDSYRAFSVDSDFSALEISSGDLIITRGINALEGDKFIYTDGENGAFKVAKVTATTLGSEDEVLYLYKQGEEEILVDRNLCKGVVFTTIPFVGTVLALVSDYYIIITAAFIVLFVAMLALLVVLCRRNKADAYDEYDDDDDYYSDDDENYSQPDDEEDEDYSDYDTDGIEQGLFSGI